MRRPSKPIVPASGGKTPAIRLNRVVLPAPFGPMTANIDPCATLKVTLSTASKPRKRLLTPAISSSAVMNVAALLRCELRASARPLRATSPQPGGDRYRRKPASHRADRNQTQPADPASARKVRSGEEHQPQVRKGCRSPR